MWVVPLRRVRNTALEDRNIGKGVLFEGWGISQRELVDTTEKSQPPRCVWQPVE